jgi:hypothetical protein
VVTNLVAAIDSNTLVPQGITQLILGSKWYERESK